MGIWTSQAALHGDASPSYAVPNVYDGVRDNAIVNGERIARLPGEKGLFNRLNLLNRQFAWSASFCGLVRHVVFVIPDKQMVRIYAKRVIANMQYIKVVRNVFAVNHHRNPMSKNVLVKNLDLSILGDARSFPMPTRIGLADFGKKPFF